jgi:tetratricopeptide (TPR) repeat protein
MSLHLDGRNKKALNDINKSIFLSSKHKGSLDRDFFHSKAIILFDLGRYEESKEWFDMALLADSRFSAAMSGKGAALVRLGNKDEAIKLFHNAIEIDSQNYNAWYNLGVMYEIDAKYQHPISMMLLTENFIQTQNQRLDIFATLDYKATITITKWNALTARLSNIHNIIL